MYHRAQKQWLPAAGRVKLGRCGLVPLHGRLDASTSISEILGIHGWAARKLRVEGEKPWFGDGRHLRCLLHVEENVSSALAIIFGEVRRFRFEVIEDTFDRRP